METGRRTAGLARADCHSHRRRRVACGTRASEVVAIQSEGGTLSWLTDCGTCTAWGNPTAVHAIDAIPDAVR